MQHIGKAALALAIAVALAACGKSGGSTTVVVAPAPTTTTTPAVTPPFRAYRVPSASMEPTVSPGAYVYAAEEPPKVGDIVVFYPPKTATEQLCGPTPHVVKLGGAACSEPVPERATDKFIKRIVAGPGDTLSIVEGHVIRNGVREPDAYIKPCGSNPECNFSTPIKIPAGDWFTLGDNRGESDDSRFWGPVPTEWIVGVVRWCSAIGTPCAE